MRAYVAVEKSAGRATNACLNSFKGAFWANVMSEASSIYFTALVRGVLLFPYSATGAPPSRPRPSPATWFAFPPLRGSAVHNNRRGTLRDARGENRGREKGGFLALFDPKEARICLKRHILIIKSFMILHFQII